MKKLFTAAALALSSVCANAQTYNVPQFGIDVTDAAPYKLGVRHNIGGLSSWIGWGQVSAAGVFTPYVGEVSGFLKANGSTSMDVGGNFGTATCTDQLGATYPCGSLYMGSTVPSFTSPNGSKQNVAIGFSAIPSITTGFQNTAVGNSVLPILTTGFGNTAIGEQVMQHITQSSFNTGVGTAVLRYMDDSGGAIIGNTALGHGAMGGDDFAYYAMTGAGDVSIGPWSMQELTSGSRNVALGMNAGMNLQTGNDNVMLGFAAQVCSNDPLRVHLPGGCAATGNVAIGSNVLQTNLSNQLVGIGYFALHANTTGTFNLAVGSNALQAETTAVGNLAIGSSALGQLVTGDHNIAIGGFALNGAGIKQYNLAIGWGSGLAMTSGGSNILIGDSSGAALTSETSNIFIGRRSGLTITGVQNTVAIGYEAAPTTSNQVVLGAAGTTEVTTPGRYTGTKFTSSTAAPAASTCGTTPAVDANSTDVSGAVTFGTGTPAACTITFTAAYPTAAYCTISPANAAAVGVTAYISAMSSSAFTITLGAGTDSVKFNYVCMGK